MLHGRGNIESEFLRRLKPHTGHTYLDSVVDGISLHTAHTCTHIYSTLLDSPWTSSGTSPRHSPHTTTNSELAGTMRATAPAYTHYKAEREVL